MMSGHGNAFCTTGPLWGESTHGFPSQSPVMHKFNVFFDVHLNEILNIVKLLVIKNTVALMWLDCNETWLIYVISLWDKIFSSSYNHIYSKNPLHSVPLQSSNIVSCLSIFLMCIFRLRNRIQIISLTFLYTHKLPLVLHNYSLVNSLRPSDAYMRQ